MNPPTANPPAHSPAPLSSLEISGAISARVIHDLANLVSGIIGNAEYAQDEAADPAGRQKALKAIGQSANNAGKLLGHCLPLNVLLTREAFTLETAELAGAIAAAAELAPGWKVRSALELHGRVLVQPRWIIAAVWQLARETVSPGGEIEFASGPAMFPVVWTGPRAPDGKPIELFQITIRYRSGQPLFSADAPPGPERHGVFAAIELVRRLKGQIYTRPKTPGRQEISILLPLV